MKRSKRDRKKRQRKEQIIAFAIDPHDPVWPYAEEALSKLMDECGTDQLLFDLETDETCPRFINVEVTDALIASLVPGKEYPALLPDLDSVQIYLTKEERDADYLAFHEKRWQRGLPLELGPNETMPTPCTAQVVEGGQLRLDFTSTRDTILRLSVKQFQMAKDELFGRDVDEDEENEQ